MGMSCQTIDDLLPICVEKRKCKHKVPLEYQDRIIARDRITSYVNPQTLCTKELKYEIIRRKQ